MMTTKTSDKNIVGRHSMQFSRSHQELEEELNQSLYSAFNRDDDAGVTLTLQELQYLNIKLRRSGS